MRNPNPTDLVMQFQAWEEAFRADFKRDKGRQFDELLHHFGLDVSDRDLLEGSVDFVAACVQYAFIDGRPVADFLALQRYDVSAIEAAKYCVVFEIGGGGAARLVLGSKAGLVDFADLYETPWNRLRRVGYSAFYICRKDGKDLSQRERSALESMVSEDLRFDLPEDEVLFFFGEDGDPENPWLRVVVYDNPEAADAASGE